ncbi:MAG TPA: DUF4301 family protein [Bacteroidales bacterium]|nr:DUF4301 family protein [Bacteroidales bacterium]
MFTKEDIQQIEARGASIAQVEKQIANFKKGFPYANLVKPATKNDGILLLSEDKINRLVSYFDDHKAHLNLLKFVPASGAASRMFKNLFTFLEEADQENQQLLLEKDKGFNSVFNVISTLNKFAFYPALKSKMAEDGIDIDKCLSIGDFYQIINYIVNPAGLNYGNLPKGLLDFHSYNGYGRKPLEEHLVEAALYASDNTGIARVHFTVSPEHMEKFRETLNLVKAKYETEYKVKFEVEFSIQKPSTDTIAVDEQNEPFREQDGKLLFRPGGHGALIENLNDLDTDIVFIKNIDNIVPDRLKPETTLYKKALAGLLTSLRGQAFEYIKVLQNGGLEPDTLEDIRVFAESDLNINIPNEFNGSSDTEKAEFLLKHLNRPFRVCGMVKNEGEPGGGPFWVKNSKGEISLQIVEGSQIDMDNKKQVDILQAATHFNPVDLVCGLKDYQGNPFNLHQFIDPETGFISVKSKSGRNLKAQELPGLWNGAMANWITIFVEVPIITFNPVKTINDLLRDQHQPG